MGGLPASPQRRQSDDSGHNPHLPQRREAVR